MEQLVETTYLEMTSAAQATLSRGKQRLELRRAEVSCPELNRSLYVAAAIDRGWQLQPARVWVHTCTLDHPRALQTYRSLGFEIYESKEQIEQLPDAPLKLWPPA